MASPVNPTHRLYWGTHIKMAAVYLAGSRIKWLPLPSSWGISESTSAIPVLSPRERLLDMATPNATPSVRLCSPSPTMMSQARGLMLLTKLERFAKLQQFVFCSKMGKGWEGGGGWGEGNV